MCIYVGKHKHPLYATTHAYTVIILCNINALYTITMYIAIWCGVNNFAKSWHGLAS